MDMKHGLELSFEIFQIGPYFLAGTNFLEMATVNYIVARLSFLATTSEVVLALKAGRLRFPSLTLKDYTIQKRVLEQFQKGEVIRVTLYFYPFGFYLNDSNFPVLRFNA